MHFHAFEFVWYADCSGSRVISTETMFADMFDSKAVLEFGKALCFHSHFTKTI